MAEAPQAKADVYDVIPYPALSFVQTHPSRMAVAARLFGLDPDPVGRCRVLEIGCATGSNLIPMAEVLPASEFVGIDRSAVEIAGAREGLAASGVANVRFECMDLCDLDDSFGQFDYIVAHGVYSWIPFDVRDRLMEVCKERLAPNGICYISYNTYPGWYHLRPIREALLYRVRDEDTAGEKLTSALAFLDLMGRFAEGGANHDLAYLDWFQTRLQESEAFGGAASQSFLFHDELAEVNEPVYFHEFVEDAERHGLNFLCEASLAAPPSYAKPDELQEIASYSRDHIDAEQYLDHAVNRMFRMSLLCHADAKVSRPIRPRVGLLAGLAVNSRATRATAKEADAEQGIVRYGLEDGAEIAFNHPVSIAAFEYLSLLSPKIVPFHELFETARLRARAEDSPKARETDELVLTVNLLQASQRRRDLAAFWAYEPPVALAPGDKPHALPYARYAAAAGERHITTLRHERADVPAVGLALLPYLDGEHSRAELLTIIGGFIADGVLSRSDSAAESEEPPSPERMLDELLDALAGFGLFLEPDSY